MLYTISCPVLSIRSPFSRLGLLQRFDGTSRKITTLCIFSIINYLCIINYICKNRSLYYIGAEGVNTGSYLPIINSGMCLFTCVSTYYLPSNHHLPAHGIASVSKDYLPQRPSVSNHYLPQRFSVLNHYLLQ